MRARNEQEVDGGRPTSTPTAFSLSLSLLSKRNSNERSALRGGRVSWTSPSPSRSLSIHRLVRFLFSPFLSSSDENERGERGSTEEPQGGLKDSASLSLSLSLEEQLRRR